VWRLCRAGKVISETGSNNMRNYFMYVAKKEKAERERLAKEDEALKQYKNFTNSLSQYQKEKLKVFLGSGNERNDLEKDLRDIHEIVKGIANVS